MLPTMAASHQPSFADQLRSTCRAVLASIEDKGRLEPPIFPTALGEPAEATAEAPAVAPALARAPAGEWRRTGRNRLTFVPCKQPVPGALVPPEVPLVSSLSGQPRLHCGPVQLPRSQKPRCRKRCYACCRMRGQPGTPPFPPRPPIMVPLLLLTSKLPPSPPIPPSDIFLFIDSLTQIS